jgi:hypothetical protein
MVKNPERFYRFRREREGLYRKGLLLTGQRLFFRSEAPGLVFSVTYLRGKLAPSAVSGTQLYAGTPEFAPLLPAIL